MTSTPTFDADLRVVGLGPAGCACAVQAARAGLSVLAIDDRLAGGLVGAANRVENLPLFPDGVDGAILAQRLVRSLRRPGVRTLRAAGAALEPTAGGFALRLAQPGAPELRGRAVCLATGTAPAPVPDWLADASVHRDVRSLPARLEGRLIAVVGGGDAAFDTALGVLRRGARVAVLVRGRKARAAAPLVRQVAEQPGIDVRTWWESGGPAERTSRGWRVIDAAGHALEIDEIVACVGRVPRFELLEALAIADDAPDWNPAAGLFVAGDVLRARQRFIAPALADGLRAADAVAAFLGEGRGS
jgi:thioredoxin reductase (NADPH)